MSLFCLCVVENIRTKNEIVFYTQQIEIRAKHYKRGIKFFVDWSEPLMSHIQKDALVINILDCPEADNCELFLLPDGWYSNGQTNTLTLRERMKFLQNISKVFINGEYKVDLYLGQSGTDQEDFFDVTLKSNDLVDYLTKTVGINGVDDGLHINVIP